MVFTNSSDLAIYDQNAKYLPKIWNTRRAVPTTGRQLHAKVQERCITIAAGPAAAAVAVRDAPQTAVTPARYRSPGIIFIMVYGDVHNTRTDR